MSNTSTHWHDDEGMTQHAPPCLLVPACKVDHGYLLFMITPVPTLMHPHACALSPPPNMRNNLYESPYSSGKHEIAYLYLFCLNWNLKKIHGTQAHQVPLPSHEGCGPVDVGGGTARETQQMEGSCGASTKPMIKIMGCFVHSLVSHPK